MKRKFLTSVFAVTALALLFTVAACGKTSETEVEIELGSVVNISQYFQDGDNLANVKLLSPDGTEVDFSNGEVSLNKSGVYKLTLSDGSVIAFTVRDTVGPEISFTGARETFFVGERIDLSVVAIDAGDGAVELSSVSVSLNGDPVDTENNAWFVPNAAGDYKIVCTAQDSKGNSSSKEFTVKVNYRTPYGNFAASLYNLSIPSLERLSAVGKEYVNKDAYSYLVNKLSSDGWAGISVKGKALIPYSRYSVVIDVETSEVAFDGYALAIYPSYTSKEALCVLAEGENTIRFDAYTDTNGDFGTDYYAWTEGAVTVLWKNIAVTFAEAYSGDVQSCTFGDTFGGHGNTDPKHTFAIKKAAGSPDFLNVGKNVGFTTMNFGGWGQATMEISGENLTPNTRYTFALQYRAENVSDANFAFIVYSNVGIGDDIAMLGLKNENTVDFTVTTDGDGKYNLTYNNFTLISNGLMITWEGIYDVSVIKGSIYGKGISVTATSGENVIADNQKYYTDGVNVGKYRTYISNVQGENGTLTISADGTAELKANRYYKVTLTLDLDGAFPAYFERLTNEWLTGGDNNTIEFYVKTDGNGEFTQYYNTYYNQGSYIDFVGITIEEDVPDLGSIYGEGIEFIAGAADGVEMKKWTEGENAGYSRFFVTVNSSKSGALVIRASAEAGLLADTAYTVEVTAQADVGGVGYIVNASEFSGEQVIGATECTLTFNVTTDANGCFEIATTTYYNGCAQIDFTGISIDTAE